MFIDTDISLNGNWVKFNEQLNEYRQRQFNNFKNINPSTKFTSEDYAINYEEERARLNIKVNESNIDKYKIVCDNNFKISPEILYEDTTGSGRMLFDYDTLIFVTSDELATEGIELVTDKDSVKNCVKSIKQGLPAKTEKL